MEYRFIDKDPAIDLVRTALCNTAEHRKDIAAPAHVHPKTLSNWLYGDVKRPQGYKLWCVFQALGIRVEYRWEATGELVEVDPALAEKIKASAPKPRSAKSRGRGTSRGRSQALVR